MFPFLLWSCIWILDCDQFYKYIHVTILKHNSILNSIFIKWRQILTIFFLLQRKHFFYGEGEWLLFCTQSMGGEGEYQLQCIYYEYHFSYSLSFHMDRESFSFLCIQTTLIVRSTYFHCSINFPMSKKQFKFFHDFIIYVCSEIFFNRKRILQTPL